MTKNSNLYESITSDVQLNTMQWVAQDICKYSRYTVGDIIPQELIILGKTFHINFEYPHALYPLATPKPEKDSND